MTHGVELSIRTQMKDSVTSVQKTWAALPLRPTRIETAAVAARGITSSPFFVLLMSAACLYSLFMPDARLVFIEPRYDKLLLAAATAVLLLFVAEMLMSPLASRDYLDVKVRRCSCEAADVAAAEAQAGVSDVLLDADDAGDAVSPSHGRAGCCHPCWWLEVGSFTFWLDILSLQALVLDVATVARDSQPLLVRYGALSELALALTRAGRVSRIGGRVIRTQPLIRKWLLEAAAWRAQQAPCISLWARVCSWCSFFRLCCCPTRCCMRASAQSAAVTHTRQQQPLQLTATAAGSFASASSSEPELNGGPELGAGQTRVGAELTALMTKRLIMGVLLAAVVVPLLSFDAVDTSKPYETMALRTGAALASSQQWLLQACALAGGRPVMSVRLPRSFAALVPETLRSLPLVSGSPNIFCAPPLPATPTSAPAVATAGTNSSRTNSSTPASPTMLSVFGTVAPLLPAQALLEPYSWRYCGNYAFLYGPGGRMGPPSPADSLDGNPAISTSAAGVMSAPTSSALPPARAGSAEACLRLRDEVALPPPNDTRAAVSILDSLVAQYSGPGTGFMQASAWWFLMLLCCL